jgi:pSer/pThr/pTyr-binding forkhead associated (FHA) protein
VGREDLSLGGCHGTYVNRQPVDLTVLANNDQAQIGKFRLVFLTAPTTESLGRPGDFVCRLGEMGYAGA